MKWFTTGIAIIIVVAALGYGGYSVYGMGYSSGETTGHDVGYASGYATGHSEGMESGYDDGYQEGQSDGYDTGEEDGYVAGFDAGEKTGYSDGLATGKNLGYDEGFQAGETDGYAQGVEDGLGHGYTVKDPTRYEVLTFLHQDTTNENEYIEDYVCSHFARDVCNNAEEQGFRCAFVELRYEGEGHTIIAFNTIDNGMMYFEPQSDEQVEPEIGKRYYQCIIPEPGYYYEMPDYDDTIKDILIIW